MTALFRFDRAAENTETTGTGGTITLDGAVAGYQTFAAAGVPEGETIRYWIEDGADWERCTGVRTGTSLTRTTEASSNSDDPLDLSGSARVFVTPAGSDLPQMLQASAVLTVGSGGDFDTLNNALKFATRYYPLHGGADVEINLLSGYAETETISVAGLNLGYIRITAEDATVDASAVTGNLFEVTQNGVLPVIACVFDMDGEGDHGVYCAEGTVSVQGGGIINAGLDNVHSIAKGTVALIEGTFTGATEHAVFLNHNSHAEIYDCDCTGAGTHGLMIRHVSTANCSIVDFRKNPPTEEWGETADIRLVSGAIMDVDAVQGGYSQTVGQLTPNGIVFFEDSRAGSPGLVLLGHGTVSNAASLAVVFDVYTEFRGFRLTISGFRPATSDTNLLLRLSTNGGSSWLTSGYRYATSHNNSFDGLDFGGNVHFGESQSDIAIVFAASNNAEHAIDGHIEILNPFAVLQPRVMSQLVSDQHNFGTVRRWAGGGKHDTDQDIDAMQLRFSSGNISAGNWALYGYY